MWLSFVDITDFRRHVKIRVLWRIGCLFHEVWDMTPCTE
jgi:hypothetical protein